MGENTKIEWCDHSWSPWRGCTKVSPGCANCYAETLSKRFPAVFGQWGKGKPRVKAKNWNDPVKWNKLAERSQLIARAAIEQGKDWPDYQIKAALHIPTVFPSLCDWLDDEVPIEWLADLLKLIHDTPRLDWLLLTKRPQNFFDRLKSAWVWHTNQERVDRPFSDWLYAWGKQGSPPENVRVGTSVEDQNRADERIPALRKIPARGRFLSLEPLLDDVELSDVTNRADWITQVGKPALNGLDWLIIGGESGHGSRPCNVDWVRSLVSQGKSAGVPVFVKQLGARPVQDIQDSRGGYLGFERFDGIRHPKGGDPAEWPADLRVREFPQWSGKEASLATA